MALGITSALIGSTEPRPVQVSVTGLTAGDVFTVTASSGSWSRVVRGTPMTATATSHLFVDVLTPLNAELTYTVSNATAGTTAATASTVTVPYAGDACFHPLDRASVVDFFWEDNADPRSPVMRTAFYDVAGADLPVMRYDVASGESGQIVAQTEGADTTLLLEYLKAGAPIVVRTDLDVRDVPPVDVIGVAGAPRRLVGRAGSVRQWELSYRTVRDPISADALVLDTFDDFDTVYAGMTFGDVDTELAGLTFREVDALDWAGGAGRL